MSSYSEYLKRLREGITAGQVEDEHETKPASGFTETVKVTSSVVKYSPNVRALDLPGRRSYVNSGSEITAASMFTHDTKAQAARRPPPPPATTVSVVLEYTGALQSFQVPAGVTSLLVRMWGAGGGGCWDYGPSSAGGGGAYVEGLLSVTPGKQLSILVGQGGPFITTGVVDSDVLTSFGGGGRGYVLGLNRASCGGGRSAIIDVLSENELATAGGGGGGGNGGSDATGGAGGLSVGQQGNSSTYATSANATHGGGGSQSVGGTGGISDVDTSVNGSQFNGGGQISGYTGGGGGGGYYGGGSGTYSGSGGGGSSYLANLSDSSNSSNGNGRTPGNTTSTYVSSTIIGYGAPAPTSDTAPCVAGNGLVVLEYTV